VKQTQSPTNVDRRWRPVDILLAAVALSLLLIGLWHLLAAQRGLDVRSTAVDGIPVTIYRPSAGDPAPVVVIAHGFAGSRQMMQPFAVTLARNGYIAVSFDFPGHGRNPAPLRGKLGTPARTRSLLEALSAVVDYARTLPGGDGRIAALGHSMAGDIIAHYIQAHPDSIDATVAVSPYLSQPVGADEPRNLLFIYGEFEPDMIRTQGRKAIAQVAGEPADAIAEDRTYGDPADGSARRLVVAQGVEHIGVLYSKESLAAALDWLDQTFDRQGSGAVDARGLWLGLYFAGVLLFARPLSRLLPRVADPPLGAGLGWGRLLPIAIAPAVITPLILAPLPADFLSIVIADYLLLHFAVYGLLTLVALRVVGRGVQQVAPARVSWPAFIAALVAVFGFETLAIAVPTQALVASYIPATDRIGLMLSILVGTMTWFAADEWLVRGPGARTGAYALTKLMFLLSLGLAIALNLEELFFLVIIVPAILILFTVYGLFSGWIYRATGHPMVTAVTNALALASAIAVSFPVVAR
jgi:dienelactone hydrolase